MTESTQRRLAGAVVGLGLGMMSSDLRWAWNHSPYDQGAGWIALAWILLIWGMTKAKSVPRVSGLIVAVGLGVVSLVGDLNLARHLAVVVWGMSFAPNKKLAFAIGFSGMAWWPALGWGMAHLVASDFACLLRVGWLGLFGGLGMWWARTRTQPKVES